MKSHSHPHRQVKGESLDNKGDFATKDRPHPPTNAGSESMFESIDPVVSPTAKNQFFGSSGYLGSNTFQKPGQHVSCMERVGSHPRGGHGEHPAGEMGIGSMSLSSSGSQQHGREKS